MKSPEPREVNIGIQVRKLFYGSTPRLMGGFSSKRKVTDVGRVCASLKLFGDCLKQVGCFATAGRAENLSYHQKGTSS